MKKITAKIVICAYLILMLVGVFSAYHLKAQPTIATNLKPTLATDFFYTDQPYLIYTTSEGNIMREYAIINGLQPVAKNHQGRWNYFATQSLWQQHHQLTHQNSCFLNNIFDLSEINLSKTCTGRTINNWPEAQKNYNFVMTSQPDLPPIYQLQDFEGLTQFTINPPTNHIIKKISSHNITEEYDPQTGHMTRMYRSACLALNQNDLPPHTYQINAQNKSFCYLNDDCCLSGSIYKYQIKRYPYYRLVTKNLELKLTPAYQNYYQPNPVV